MVFRDLCTLEPDLPPHLQRGRQGRLVALPFAGLPAPERLRFMAEIGEIARHCETELRHRVLIEADALDRAA